MIVIHIPLQQVLIDVVHGIDLSVVAADEANNLLMRAYAFLPPPVSVQIANGIATITSTGESNVSGRTRHLFEQAGSEARRGRYARATALFQRVIEQTPAYADAYYNLAMAHLELGNHSEAERQIINALNLAPNNPYSLLLLGNIYLQHRDRADIAERLYLQAASAGPADPYILSNIGGLLAKRAQHQQAQQYFDQAITADPRYPNAYYGKALSFQREGDYATAVAVLDKMFAQPESIDIRAEPVYQEARCLYLMCLSSLARSQSTAQTNYIDQWRTQLEQLGGIEIELVHDAKLSLAAVAEVAWHRADRKSHVIRYRDRESPVRAHLIAHELQHIALEIEARAAGRNRFFVTTDDNHEAALKSIRSDVNDLKRSGELGDLLDSFIAQIVAGLANQILNTPLDFVIEHYLYHDHPVLRSSQFVSLYETQKQNLKALEDPQLKRITPRLIYNANLSMNAAYAMFIDELLGGSTDYAAPYNNTRFQRTGRSLFALWLDVRQNLQPGDEYKLVDSFAETLRLQDWYKWTEDVKRPLDEGGGGVTNEELLKAKMPAAIMYCLSALQRFDGMDKEDIRRIVAEIALLGQSGLDYSSPDKKYTLHTISGELFSGLQLMSLMYVGLKDIEPTVDSGMDLEHAYQAALQLHEGQP